MDNHYEDPNPLSDDCHPCTFPCLTCETTATTCLSCEVGLNRKTSHPCTCENGYYEHPTTQNCEQCSIECETCDNPDTCLTCKPGNNRLDLSGSC